MALRYDVARKLAGPVFVNLGAANLGAPAKQFLDDCRTGSLRAGSLRTTAQKALRWAGMSHFDANGLLNMYPLHLCSTDHLTALKAAAGVANSWRSGLDVGAGDGRITKQLQPLFTDPLAATETSKWMTRRLRTAGFSAWHGDLCAEGGAAGLSLALKQEESEPCKFDVVAILNVLDRCPQPRTLLQSAVQLIRPGGYCIVSSPLPFKPFWFAGGQPARPLEEFMSELLGTFEDEAEELLGNIAEAGLRPLAYGRLPYLSSGDSKREFFEYDACLALFQKAQ